MSMDLISAPADTAKSNNAENNAIVFLIFNLLM
jgi:hypothetical protein